MKIKVNGAEREVKVDGSMPLLWALRDELKITGPKFGCGMSLCGACTVHMDGVAVRSCTLPIAAVTGEITTIDSGSDGQEVAAVKKAWIQEQVAQCGYCQPGQIMSAAAILKNNPTPSPEEISGGMSGNLCRCGTYPRINRAIQTAVKILDAGKNGN